MSNKILVFESDEGIQKFLMDLFIENGFTVEVAKDPNTTLRLIKKTKPDLVVIDLDELNKIEKLYLNIKKQHPGLSTILLTIKDHISCIKDKVSINNEDYILKPFDTRDLLALITSKFKSFDDSRLIVADLEINSKTFEVKRDGKTIILSPHEFKLLQYLLNNKGRVLSREMILNKVWLYSFGVDTRVVDVYIGYLRRKIDSNFEKKLIHSVRGFGYMIKE